MDTKTGYKIMEERDGELYPLFHGKKPLAYNVWHQAAQKEVIDGSGGRPYLSGFHFLFSIPAARRFLQRFRKPRTLALVRCRVRDFRPKPRSHAWLANSVMLLKVIMYVDVPYTRRYQERWMIDP